MVGYQFRSHSDAHKGSNSVYMISHDDVVKWKHFPPVTDGVPSQWPVTRSFDVFFDLYLHKSLSKQSGRRWFDTPSRSLWRNYKCIKVQPLTRHYLL